MVQCPLCDAEIDVDETDVDEGDSLTCDECGSELHVVGVDPLELEAADEEDEDDEFLDDDEDEDEEEEEADWK